MDYSDLAHDDLCISYGGVHDVGDWEVLKLAVSFNSYKRCIGKSRLIPCLLQEALVPPPAIGVSPAPMVEEATAGEHRYDVPCICHGGSHVVED